MATLGAGLEAGASDLPGGYVKCVVVGDGAVGKTCLLVSYTTNKFPTQHVPTVFENYAVTASIEGTPTVLGLFDTAGQEEYDRLRVLAYPNTNVFIVCFSVVRPWSFENVEEKWVPEVTHHSPRTPFILVGTKIDLRTNEEELEVLKRDGLKAVTTEEGQGLADRLGALGYVECSALTQEGTRQVFEVAVKAAKSRPGGAWTKPRRAWCRLL